MSTYTTEVRYICESKSGFTVDEIKNKTVDEIIEAARQNVFNFTFPVYDEEFRPVLESTILLHFYTREIGCETVGLWQHYLCRKMRELMPYYNKLFESALLEFNPLYDTDYTKSHEGNMNVQKAATSSRNATGTAARNATGNRTTNTTEGRMGTETTSDNGTVSEVTDGNTSTTNTDTRTEVTDSTTEKTGQRTGNKTTHDTHSKSNDHKDYYSDTPMTKVEGVNGMDSGSATLGANYYLTNYRRIKDDEEGENNGTESQTENTTENGEGHSEVESTGNASGTGTTHGTKAVNTTDAGSRNTTDNLTGQQTDETTDESNETTTNDETGTNNETVHNTDAYVDRVVGKMGGGTYSAMIIEFRETIVNFMAQLLNDLEPLFMNIW